MTELKESKSAGGAAVGSRPWPLADELTAPFWDAAAAQRLVVQRCTECALLRFRRPLAARTAIPTVSSGRS